MQSFICLAYTGLQLVLLVVVRSPGLSIFNRVDNLQNSANDLVCLGMKLAPFAFSSIPGQKTAVFSLPVSVYQFYF